ncbi:hypothetical protein ACB098_10G056400 [Castanea mollissima]
MCLDFVLMWRCIIDNAWRIRGSVSIVGMKKPSNKPMSRRSTQVRSITNLLRTRIGRSSSKWQLIRKGNQRDVATHLKVPSWMEVFSSREELLVGDKLKALQSRKR